MNRRQFVAGALASTVSAWKAGASTARVPTADSSCPQAEEKKAQMKVGLYTITFLGAWYRGEAVKPEDIIGRAKG